MLAPHGPLGPMGAHRDQAEEGVEVETAQRADMGADAEVALREEGLGSERQANGQRCGQHRQRGAGRIEPGDARRRQDELEAARRSSCPPRSGRSRSGAGCGCARPCPR